MSTVTITRTFDAPPERVFAAWTEPAEIARWYGPQQLDAAEDRMPAQPARRPATPQRWTSSPRRSVRSTGGPIR